MHSMVVRCNLSSTDLHIASFPGLAGSCVGTNRKLRMEYHDTRDDNLRSQPHRCLQQVRNDVTKFFSKDWCDFRMEQHTNAVATVVMKSVTRTTVALTSRSNVTRMRTTIPPVTV